MHIKTRWVTPRKPRLKLKRMLGAQTISTQPKNESILTILEQIALRSVK